MMTSLQIQKKKKKQISIELQNALNELLVDFEKLQPKVDRVFEIGKLEGLDDKEIGSMVRNKMKEHYSERTIRKVLPDTAKHSEKVRKFAAKSSANEHEDEDEEKYENTIWHFKAEEFNINDFATRNRGYLIDATEHFYTEARKWKAKYEELAKSKKQNKEKGSDADKAALGEKLLKMQRERLAEGGESK